MRLNLGCGFNRIEGYVNVDSWPECNPDIVCVLDKDSWPFKENSVDFVVFDHSLEHMGASTDEFFHVIKELYRVCKPNTKVLIKVPHPDNRLFKNDPTHVRPIYAETLWAFDKSENIKHKDLGFKNSKLGLLLNVNLRVDQVTYIPDSRLVGVAVEDLEKLALSENNVISEIHLKLTVIKE